MASKYNRSISMQCSTCGNTEFENTADDKLICSSCERIFLREDLLQENQELISNNVEEVKKEIVQDIQKQFKNMLKKMK